MKHKCQTDTSCFFQVVRSFTVPGRHAAGDLRQHHRLRLRVRRRVLLADVRTGQRLHQEVVRPRTEVQSVADSINNLLKLLSILSLSLLYNRNVNHGVTWFKSYQSLYSTAINKSSIFTLSRVFVTFFIGIILPQEPWSRGESGRLQIKTSRVCYPLFQIIFSLLGYIMAVGNNWLQIC